MHGGEVRDDWEAFGKDKQEWSSGVTTVGLGVFEGTTAGGAGWQERREGRGGKDNRATSNTLCLSPGASFIGGGCDEALKAFQQELRDCAYVLSTCMRAQSHLCKKKKNRQGV